MPATIAGEAVSLLKRTQISRVRENIEKLKKPESIANMSMKV